MPHLAAAAINDPNLQPALDEFLAIREETRRRLFAALGRLMAERGIAQRWRIALFSFLVRSSQPATRFFNIPPDRVMEIGTQIAL